MKLLLSNIELRVWFGIPSNMTWDSVGFIEPAAVYAFFAPSEALIPSTLIYLFCAFGLLVNNLALKAPELSLVLTRTFYIYREFLTWSYRVFWNERLSFLASIYTLFLTLDDKFILWKFNPAVQIPWRSLLVAVLTFGNLFAWKSTDYNRRSFLFSCQLFCVFDICSALLFGSNDKRIYLKLAASTCLFGIAILS
jgi:hypothetical protein